MTREKDHSRFSRRAIKKSVRASSANHPMTLFPAAVGLLGIVGGGLFGSPIALGAGVGGLLVGAGYFVTNYFLRFETVARNRMKAMHQEMLQKLQARPGELRLDFEEAGFERGVSQLEMAKIKFDEFIEALQRKFDETELTFGRYSGVSETVYLSILDNLELAVAKLRSVRSIDPDYIEKQLKQLESKNAAASEIETLNIRLQLRETALKEVDAILARNERAMTTLDGTALTVAGIQTRKASSVKDADLAMSELELLAARAADYEGK